MRLPFFCALFAIAAAGTLNAQPWMKGIPTQDPNFYDIQKSFNQYWSENPIEKGKGYKSFKRWEWFWEQRVGSTGEFPPADIRFSEWENYQKSHHEKDLPPGMKAANWSFKGPSNSNGGYSGIGRVSCIAFHPSNAQIFWIGTPAGGVWKTTNGGASWTTSTDNLPVLGVTDIAVDPNNPNTLYAATGDGDSQDTYSVGVLKSTDGGSTWNTTGLNWNVTGQKTISRIIIDRTRPNILLAATSDGIWRTSNSGTSWTKQKTGSFSDLEINPSNPDIMYAASKPYGNAQIFTSTNNGVTWTQVTNFFDYNRINLAVSANNPSLVDALCAGTDGGLAGLWYSTDNGSNFEQYYFADCTNNLLGYSAEASGCGGQGWYDLAYAINPSDVNEIYLGGINTWRTSDGGSNWSLNNIWSGYFSQDVPEVHADKHFLAFHPLNNNTIFECNDGGIYKSTNDGVSWTDISNGLGNSQIYRLGTSATVANNVICGLQDNGTKELKNGSMTDRTGGDGMECLIDYSNPQIQYSTYVQGKIYKTTDGWVSNTTIVENSGTGVDESGAWVTPYIMHPTDHLTLLLGKSQVYKTTNGGNNWTQLGDIVGISGKIKAMAYAPSNTNTIYVATDYQLFKTTNGGTSWTSIRQTSQQITYIMVDPADAQRVFYTTSGYSAGSKVWFSSNGGSTWSNISGTLPNVPANCIVYQNKTTDKGYFVGTDLGVYYRGENMGDWVKYSTGLPNVVVNELEISYVNNKLWAATYGRGLWNTDLYSSVGVDETDWNQRISIYPNPNNGEFSIVVPQNITYDLKIMNVVGHEILSQQNINRATSSYSINELSNGVYMVQLIIDGQTITKKVIVQRQ